MRGRTGATSLSGSTSGGRTSTTCCVDRRRTRRARLPVQRDDGTTAGGTFQAGQFHVANPTTGATYTNTAAVNFLANQSTPCPIQADVPGTASSSGAGQITQLVTPIAGATCTNSAALVGTNIETNAGYFARCVTKLGSISIAGPAAAYDFAVQTLTQVDPAGVLPSPPYLLSGGAITRSFTRANTQTGVVTTVCGNSTGAVLGPSHQF